MPSTRAEVLRLSPAARCALARRVNVEEAALPALLSANGFTLRADDVDSVLLMQARMICQCVQAGGGTLLSACPACRRAVVNVLPDHITLLSEREPFTVEAGVMPIRVVCCPARKATLTAQGERALTVREVAQRLGATMPAPTQDPITNCRFGTLMRLVYELGNGKPAPNNFLTPTPIKDLFGASEATLMLAGKPIQAAVTHGTEAIQALLKRDTTKYTFILALACSGG